MRTDLKVGVICLFALVLACVGFFAYHSNRGGTDGAAAPSHPAANHALSVGAPADGPTTAPSLAPAAAPSLASAFGPSHALGADTFSGTISPPSPTTAPSNNNALVPPSGSTGLGASSGTSSPGGLSSPGGAGGMSAPSSLNQPLVPSSGSTGLVPSSGTSMSNGSPSLLPPSTGPSSLSGGFGSPAGTSGTSNFGTGSTGTTSGSSRTSSLEIGPAPSNTTHGSSLDTSGFGTSSSSSFSTGSSGGEYAIQKGDTIAALAKKNHTTTKAVLAANPGVNPNRLKVGQKIKIPEASSATGSSSSSALGGSSLAGSSSTSFDTTFGTGSATTKPATKGHKGSSGATTRSASKGGKATGSQASLAGGTYTIKKGDTLRKIAKSVYGDERVWRRIFRENRGDLASPNALKVGETIRLPK